MSVLKEFREFAVKGNMVDLAIGVIVGGAFGKVVDSLVKDMVMPLFARLLGGVDFKEMYWNLSGVAFENLAAAEKAGVPIIKYGVFTNTIVNFVVVAVSVFAVVKMLNAMRRKNDAKT